MNRRNEWLLSGALATVMVAGEFACALLWQSKQDEHRLAVQVGAVLTDITRPCKGPHGPDACGTLAEINETVIKIGDIAVTAQLQVNQTSTLVAQYGKLLNGIATDIHGEMTEAQKTTAALTGTAQQAKTTLATANTVIAAEQPHLDDILKHADLVLTTGNDAVARFNAMLADPNIALTMKNVQGMTASGNHMLFTADAVETKATKGYLHPPTNPAARAWMEIKPFLIPAAQVGGAVAIAIH